MSRRRIAGTGVGILLIVTLVFAHEGHKSITTKGVTLGPVTGNLLMEPLARKAIGLSTAKADFGTIEETLRVPARVVLPPTRHGFASTRVAGIVDSIKVKPGDFVKAGDVLAELSSLELESLRLDLAHRTLEKKLLEENLARVKALGERLIAGKELLDLETELKDKTNETAVLRRKLVTMGIPPDRVEPSPENGPIPKAVPIVAPLEGVIVHIDAALGQSVEPREHLFEIHAPSVVWIEGEVPESRISSVREGLAVRALFPAYPGRVYSGKVERIGSEVPEKSRTVIVRATVENVDLALKPGLFGELSIVTGVAENATTVPVGAIIEDGAERYALVQLKVDTYFRTDPKEKLEEYSPLKKDGFTLANSYVKKNVVVGRTDGRLVEILDGLYPGDTVVRDASHELASLFVQGSLKLSEEARKNIALQTEEVDLRTVDDVVRLNAVFQVPVDRRAFASTRIEGKILKISVEPGEEVAAGQTLAEVHSLELDALQLDYYRAVLRERLLGTLADQLRSLGEVSPRKDLLKAETDHRREVATKVNLRRRLEIVGLSPASLDRLGETGETVPSVAVVSPIAGRVSEVDVVLGKVVKAGDHLFRIADPRRLWAEAKVFERDFRAVLQGEPRKDVVLRANGREVKTKLSFVAQSMGYEENVLPVFAEIPAEDTGFLPGMIAEMQVVVGRPEKKVIAAPLRAILAVGGQAYGFVATGSTFKRVPLELGRQDAEFVEVTKGLFPGDKVAVSGVNDLNTALNMLK